MSSPLKAFLARPLAVALLLSALSGLAQVRITEFMASNTRTLADEDGQYSDWIELQNTNGSGVNLLNWALTDSANNSRKWLFPSTNISPRSFLIVFASGLNRRTPGLPLHTNFKLSAGGGYLALTRPDGLTASAFAPSYPEQFPDVSYGVALNIATETLVSSNAPVRILVPTAPPLDPKWVQPGYNDDAWPAGTNGLGYYTGVADPLENSFAGNVLQTGPVAYWRLNETNGPEAVNSGSAGVGDEAGYLGGVLLGAPGPRPPRFGGFETNNNAPSFNGIDASVNGPYQLLGDLASFTMAGWIYPTGPQNSRTGLFGQNDTMEFGFISPGVLQLWSFNGSVNASYPFNYNEWHYVTATGGNGQLALYLDGILAASSPATGPTFGNSEFDFNIGGGGVFDPTGNYFAGKIDEVAVWRRALSTSEIATLTATNAPQVAYTDYINTDMLATMFGSNSTTLVRIPFTVGDPSIFDSLNLSIRFDDGFAAYLNGNLIASSNVPAVLDWNSAATQRHPNALAVQWTDFDASAARPYLQPGTNVLAIQALNIAATNTDFLMQAQLTAESVSGDGSSPRYLTVPTPGEPNGIGADLGPIMSGAAHSPAIPGPADPLVVSASVAQGFSGVTNVTLHYRVMFAAESSTPMNDSGLNGDVVAGDAIWTGAIPAGLAAPGQMIRYYVTAADSAGHVSRWPLFSDNTASEQYLGTVAADPSVQSELPVARLFIQNPGNGDTQVGTQASLFYLNELYDNVSISVHGQSSTGWPKKSHNFTFPKDHLFLYQSGGVRRKKIIFLSNYSDKARMRTTLTLAMAARAGGAALFSFPIRLHVNGPFWGVEDMVEDGDEDFLARIGRDPNGALYKMYNEMSTASGNEKKTRAWEGTADLTALITSLDESVPWATRIAYGYDHLDLPQTANYFATMALTSSQDLGHKNYYLYCDNDGTGEWAIMPWDLDLTWGRDWVDSIGYFSDILYQTNTLSFYNTAIQNKPANRLFDLFFEWPEFRQMYLRRLRTLMDTILMPPGTPTNSLVIEPLVRQFESKLNPPGISPSDTALDYRAWGPSWGSAALSQFPNDAERLITTHLAGRRSFLFNSPSAVLYGDAIPAAQPPGAALAIASWDYNPSSGNLGEQFVELRNTNSFAVDASNWRLGGGIAFAARPGTVVPAGKSLYLAADVNTFRARKTGPRGGQSLYVQGPFGGNLSSLGNTPLLLWNGAGALVSSNAFAATAPVTQFAAGNLAVVRVGDGSETLGSAGNSIFIDQITPAGAIVGSVAVPDNGTSALLISGSSSSEGSLSRSPDGALLVFAGYNISLSNAAAAGSSLANATASDVPRVLGVVDATGSFRIAAVSTVAYNKNNIRGGATDGMGNFWGAGANTGTYYFGEGEPGVAQNLVANTIAIEEFGGNLYFTTAKGSPGLWEIPGAPVTGPVTPNLVLSLAPGAGPSAFAFNSGLAIAYVADNSLAGAGGVQRWDFAGGSWSMSYAFEGLTNVGATGLAVDFGGSSPVIYATTAESSRNRLVSMVDTGPASPVTTLATAGFNQLFHGVALAPVPVATNMAPEFTSVRIIGNTASLAWTGLSNRVYTLQSAEGLGGGSWTTVTNIMAASTNIFATDPSPLADSARFYRLILNP